MLGKLAADGAKTIDLRGAARRVADARGGDGGGGGRGVHGGARGRGAVAARCDLPATWDEYLGTLSKKDRHELRRKLRRLESGGGDVELKVVTDARGGRAGRWTRCST